MDGYLFNLMQAIAQLIEKLPRNPPAIDDAQFYIRLIRSMKIAAAGFDQVQSIGQIGQEIDHQLIEIAMNDLEAAQSLIDEIFDFVFELRKISLAKLRRMRQHRQSTAAANHLHRPRRR